MTVLFVCVLCTHRLRLIAGGGGDGGDRTPPLHRFAGSTKSAVGGHGTSSKGRPAGSLYTHGYKTLYSLPPSVISQRTVKPRPLYSIINTRKPNNIVYSPETW